MLWDLPLSPKYVNLCRFVAAFSGRKTPQTSAPNCGCYLTVQIGHSPHFEIWISLNIWLGWRSYTGNSFSWSIWIGNSMYKLHSTLSHFRRCVQVIIPAWISYWQIPGEKERMPKGTVANYTSFCLSPERTGDSHSGTVPLLLLKDVSVHKAKGEL